MSSIYEAVPLNRDTSSTNIRVIESLFRDLEGQIHCKLRTISLGRKSVERKSFNWESPDWKSHEKESYRALSYAWGPPGKGNSILVDGKLFEVRTNLWDFLNEACTRGVASLKSALRQDGQRDFLWIDAICIDQSQVEERNHQVAMMGDIYSKARSVLVWLGPSTAAIAGLLQNMHGLTVDEYYKLAWETEMDDQEMRVIQSGLEELCGMEYWERLWVVQEYLLARNVDIWCGMDSVDPEKIKWLVYVEFKTARLAESCAMELLQGRKVRNAHVEQLSLKRHLDDFGIRMKCADVRDHVYGLLALINKEEREKLRIRPNYALPPDGLFFELSTELQKSELYSLEELLDYVDTLRQALGLHSDNEVVRVVNQAIEARCK